MSDERAAQRQNTTTARDQAPRGEIRWNSFYPSQQMAPESSAAQGIICYILCNPYPHFFWEMVIKMRITFAQKVEIAQLLLHDMDTILIQSALDIFNRQFVVFAIYKEPSFVNWNSCLHLKYWILFWHCPHYRRGMGHWCTSHLPASHLIYFAALF